jgi:hypothetical protein
MKIVPRVESLMLPRFGVEGLESMGSFDPEYNIAW